MTSVEDNAVAGFQWSVELENDLRAQHAGDVAEVNATLLAEPRVDQFLIVDPTKPAGVKTTRERHLQVILRFAGAGRRCGVDFLGQEVRVVRQSRGAFVQGAPIRTRDVGDILWSLQASLDLQRGDSSVHESGQHFQPRQVLRTQQIFAITQRDELAIRDQLVGHATRLGALAAICGTTTQSFAGQALTGVGHAERAVDKHFERERAGGSAFRRKTGGLSRLNLFNLANGTFPGEHHQIAAKLARKVHAGRACHGHLRRGVNRKVGRDLADDPADADVLNDGGIDTGRDDRADVLHRIGDLILEHQRVERHVAAHAAPVQELHQPGQGGFGKVMGAHPRVEPVETEIDGVRAILHRCLGAFPITRRREQFRQARPAGFSRGRRAFSIGSGLSRDHQAGEANSDS